MSAQLPTQPVATSLATAHVKLDAGNPRRLTLYIDSVPSSHVDLDDPTYLEFEYMQWFAAAINSWFGSGNEVLGPRMRGLHLGGGGCTMARYLSHHFPGSHHTAVEIDEKLAALVRQWFDLPRSPQVKIRVADARDVLDTTRHSGWEVIIRDAFTDAEVPRNLVGVDAIEDVYRALAPDGIYLANCADHPPLPKARREVATLQTVFGDAVALAAEPGQLRGRRFGNVLLIAAKDGDRLREVIPQIARALRSTPVPARVLYAQELKAFAGTAAIYSQIKSNED